MNKRLRRLGLSSAIVAVLGGIGSSVAGDPKPQDASPDKILDARREAQLLTSYGMNQHLHAFDLAVSVNGSDAILSGNVEDSVDKDLAEQIAMGVNGITHVDNRIRVDAAYVQPVHAISDRSFGEKVEDATITASVKSRLLWNSNTDGLDIHVDTTRGKVTLTGSADSNTQEILIARIARNTEGVLSVNNEIALADQRPAKAKVRDAGALAVSDSWITIKVKSSLTLTRNMDSADITVTTVDGVVSLHGVVDTAAERERAVQVSRDIRGVKKVEAGDLTVG
jgi:hyperosmotically inducible periplasmic protein